MRKLIRCPSRPSQKKIYLLVEDRKINIYYWKYTGIRERYCPVGDNELVQLPLHYWIESLKYHCKFSEIYSCKDLREAYDHIEKLTMLKELVN